MTTTTTQLTGGHFQDAEGNVLANGYLLMLLNQDSTVTGVGNICAGVEIKIQLDASGDVAVSPAQSVWATDVLAPPNAYYRVTGYTVQGQPAWGPNNQQVSSNGTGGGTFDLGTWVPNQVISWNPPVQIGKGVALETNGTPNAVQTLLNLESTDSSVIITDLGNGSVNLQSSGAKGPDLVRTSLWTPANVSQSAGFISGEDAIQQSDSGATFTYQLPTASVNYGAIQAGNRVSFGSRFIYGGRNFTFLTTAIGTYTDTETFFFIGVIDNIFGGGPSDLRPPSGAQVGIYKPGTYGSEVSSDVWHCRVSNGSLVTEVATTVAAQTRSVWEIDYTPTSVVFKANGVVVATITTNLPTVGTMAMVFGSDGYQNTLTSEYLYCAANAA